MREENERICEKERYCQIMIKREKEVKRDLVAEARVGESN